MTAMAARRPGSILYVFVAAALLAGIGIGAARAAQAPASAPALPDAPATVPEAPSEHNLMMEPPPLVAPNATTSETTLTTGTRPSGESNPSSEPATSQSSDSAPAEPATGSQPAMTIPSSRFADIDPETAKLLPSSKPGGRFKPGTSP